MERAKQAQAAEDSGDLQACLVLWREIAAEKKDPISWVSYGRLAEQLELWDEAESAFSHALALKPGSAVLMELLGVVAAQRADWRKKDLLEVARDWFERSAAIERTFHTLTFLGCACIRLNRISEAKVALEGALEINPEWDEAMYNLAILEEKSNPSKAIEFLEKAVQIDRKYKIAHHVLGRLYCRQKEYSKAEQHLRRCLEFDSQDYWSKLYLAHLLGVTHRNDEAEQVYRSATEQRPELEGGFKIFANFLKSIGKVEQAAAVRAKIK